MHRQRITGRTGDVDRVAVAYLVGGHVDAVVARHAACTIHQGRNVAEINPICSPRRRRRRFAVFD